MKDFTDRGEKILRNIRRKDFDVIMNDLPRFSKEEISKLKEMNKDDKKLLYFLSFFEGNSNNNLMEIVNKIKNIPDEDIKNFQKFQNIDSKNNEGTENVVNTTYLIDKYSYEELAFLESLTDEDLDLFEEDFEEFVDDDEFYEDELDNEYYIYEEIEEELDFCVYNESDYYDDCDEDYSDLDFFVEKTEEQYYNDDVNEPDETYEIDKTVKDSFEETFNNRENNTFYKFDYNDPKYDIEKDSNKKTIVTVLGIVMGLVILIGCIILFFL